MSYLTLKKGNNKKNKGGRPFKFKNSEALQKAVNKYFNETPQEEHTITGLALHIGSRQLLCNYEENKNFSLIIKIAKLKVEHAYELSLRKHGRSGDIFALKNMGWKDTPLIDNSETHNHYVIHRNPESAAEERKISKLQTR